jgi:hypothetical protein
MGQPMEIDQSDGDYLFETEHFFVKEVYFPQGMPKKIFSFSLFESVPGKFYKEEWRTQYLYGQLHAMYGILYNPLWLDYGIYHLITKDLADAIFDRDSTQFKNDGGLTVDEYQLWVSIFSTGRYCYGYYNITDSSISPYYGTCLRYIPLCIGHYDLVLFRDAHSTMPNSTGGTIILQDGKEHETSSLDRRWIEHLEYPPNPNVQFMFYYFAGYQPVHAKGNPRLLAGAWGARRYPGYDSIITDDEFISVFGNGELAKRPEYNESKYGVDEQMLNEFYRIYNLANRSIHIGITWILYLFYPMLQLKNKMHTSMELHDGQYCTQSSNVMSVNIYYGALRCLLVAAIKEAGENITTITLRDLINIMGRSRRYFLGGLSPHTTGYGFYKNIISMIPDGSHLWNCLFEVGNLDVTLKEYLAEGSGRTDDAEYSNELLDMCESDKRDLGFFLDSGDIRLT